MIGFDLSNIGAVEGYYKFYPFASDSNVGSFKGTYNTETNIIMANVTAYGEGEIYKDQRIWKVINDTLISGYTKEQSLDYKDTFKDLTKVIWMDDLSTPKVQAATIDTWMTEINDKWKKSSEEEIDIERIKEVAPEAKNSPSSIVSERYVDIDSNYKTKETAYYLSKQKTLFILNKENTILATYKNVSSEVYLNSFSSKTKWKDLVVNYKGVYKLLRHDNGSYPKDLNIAPTLSNRAVK